MIMLRKSRSSVLVVCRISPRVPSQAPRFQLNPSSSGAAGGGDALHTTTATTTTKFCGEYRVSDNPVSGFCNKGVGGGGGGLALSSALRTTITRHDPISLIDPSTSLSSVKQIHGHLLVQGHLNAPHSLGKFVYSLVLSHYIGYSELLIRSHAARTTTFMLNNMIRAYCKSTTPLHSFHYYNQILRCTHRLSPDNYTFTFLVRACAQLPSFHAGVAVHGVIVKRGFICDPHVQSALLHMYAELGLLEFVHKVYFQMNNPDLVCQTAMVGACAECGEIEFARELFETMPKRDPIAWNALIAGYEHLGQSREALDLFHRMQLEGVKVDEATMVSVLSACADLGASDQGRWAHVFIERNNLLLSVKLGTALIDMYSKCGDMRRAMEVFWHMREKNVYTWSTAMNGLTMNGSGKECLELFELMRKENVVLPNAVTFVSVLRGCGVAGLVDKGRQYFDSMMDIYNIEPWLEHYGCMIDLYGRAGRLQDAIDFINAMPIEPHVEAWGALLHSCRIHGNKTLGELALSKIVELETRHDGAHVLLSNIYAETNNWDGVGKVRELMKIKGVKKEPGCSVIEIAGEIHEFFAGAKTHPSYQEIEAMLEEMTRRMKSAGYVAKTNQVLFDIEEEEKEDALGWHSEKLAIAFGLLRSKAGEAIRIVKNLRVCWDCHDATKIISKVFDREIVVRDRNRFHHFRDGSCSCMDFW